MFVVEVSYGCPSEKYPTNGNFQFDQASALKAIGEKIVFIAIDMRSIRKKRRLGLYEHEKSGIPIVEYSFPFGPIMPKLRTKLSIHGFKRALNLVINKYGVPDLVHVHFNDTAKFIIKPCEKKGIPYVITEHSSGVNKDDLSANQISELTNIYSKAKAVIAVSHPLAERIENFSSVHPYVVPNIIDFSVFHYNVKRKALPFRYVSAGNLIKRKGFDVTIKAFSEVVKKYNNVELVIMGDGPELGNLSDLICELGLKNKVLLYNT